MKHPENTWIEQLKTFLSFPSISSDHSQKKSVRICAAWLYSHLKNIGLAKVKMYETSSHPVIYAEHIIHPAYPTILFYGHYDVQPVDPLEKWTGPPFIPVIKGNYIFGRGASDDKGQIFIHLKAVEQFIRNGTNLSANIKFLIEGAEEIGSEGLQNFISAHRGLLQCDVAVVSDTKMATINIPAITYSLRGSLNVELFLKTMRNDLHSGTFGGIAPNAIDELGRVISRLHDSRNAIAIPGFYDDVEEISARERDFMQANGSDERQIFQNSGIPVIKGESGYSHEERCTIRPALSVTGVTAGFQGEGVKNVIPAAASMKLNFRLAQGQSPENVRLQVDKFIKELLPARVLWKAVYSSLANPVSVSRDNIYVKAASTACEKVFKHKTRFIRSGGTIAAVDFISSILQIPIVLMGFGQADDNMHAPDERFYLPNFFRGIQASQNFIENVSKLNTKTHAPFYY